uniref:ATP-binding cassette sub-family B member 8, mitochondrial n=1 Tax=Cacopsylla melanoneura TaxID=428564 RepID=A0A8D9BQR2_9HEMI
MLVSLLKLSTSETHCKVSKFFRVHQTGFNSFRLNRFGKNIFSKVTRERDTKIKESNLTLKFCLATSGICIVKLIHDQHTVSCQFVKSRASDYADQSALSNKQEPDFDWEQFFRLLWPEIWSLLGAVASALAVAFLNIQLPLYLGNIINILSQFSQNTVPDKSFMSEMKEPALKLVGLYIAQSVFTCAYISLLSGLGERIAAKLRCQLFESILKQDIAFFDTTRTGELVDRLTTDVQEFKSSFKLVVSQGLRNGAQVIGAVSSLLIISPSLTLGMLGIVPVVIVTGTFIGSLLRSISRRAQDQAAKAVTIGEEAISNIRTVRAFAMEPYESELFSEQVSKACDLHESLGLGVGLFQAGTNLFLNGMVLGTLYYGGHLMATTSLTAGDLMSFLVSTQMIQRSIAQMSLLFGSYIKGLSSGARIFQLINLKPKISSEGGYIVSANQLIPEIQFNDVTFAYPSRPSQTILKNFNLRIPAGQKVAIVGSSGNGKSTIVALLERWETINLFLPRKVITGI